MNEKHRKGLSNGNRRTMLIRTAFVAPTILTFYVSDLKAQVSDWRGGTPIAPK
jgi:hypothetical protein